MEDNRPYSFLCQIYLPHFRHTSAAAQCQAKLEFSFNNRGKRSLWMFRWSHCGAAERQLVREMIVSKQCNLLSCPRLSVCAFFFNDMPWVIFISISLFPSLLLLSHIIKPIFLFFHAAPHLFRPFIFASIPLSHLSPSLTPLPPSPLLPLVPPQTNGAHYRLTKNSPAAKSIHFFPFLSFSLPSFLMLLFFLFPVPPSGGK